VTGATLRSCRGGRRAAIFLLIFQVAMAAIIHRGPLFSYRKNKKAEQTDASKITYSET
jgi:hypothetical protein